MNIESKAPLFIKNKSTVLFIPIIIITTLVSIDFALDINDGFASKEGFVLDFIIEAMILFSSIFMGVYLANNYFSELKKNKEKSITISNLNRDIAEWEKKIKDLKQDYKTQINQYLQERWELSKSEIKVTHMILKGYTYKEIAKSRNVSERTVRNQAQSIYEKSNLQGRKELSAFFLNNMIDS